MIGPTVPASDMVHAEKYRGKGETYREACNRESSALQDNHEHYMAYRDARLQMRYLSAGRVQAAMGSLKNITPYNCFVMPTMHDSFTDGPSLQEISELSASEHPSLSIMDVAKAAAITMRQGGGVGYDISTLRPRGDLIRGVQSVTDGPMAFAPIYDAVCGATASAGNRRGAQMLVMRADHPDIEIFIRAKQGVAHIPYEYRPLRGFNMSIAITDELMECVQSGKPFPLQFGGEVYREVDPHALWEMIMRGTYDWAEPGVLFIDTINRLNNLYYCETIAATNPCFTGDTEIWTADGPKKFSELEGKRVKVLTENTAGKLVIRSMDVFKTAKDQQIVKVTLDDGSVIRCTPEHEFFDIDRQKVKAISLTSEMRLASVYRHNANSRPNHKVISVEYLTETEDVFCGTVEETHKFFVRCNRGAVLVSNCGEQPLPPYGACLLGSFNLVKYLSWNSTTREWEFQWSLLGADIPNVVRAMDNIVDRARYPLPEQRKEAQAKRRMGLGVTGLANCIEAMGFPYGSPDFLRVEDDILRFITRNCYIASAMLAKEKGSFPLYDEKLYLSGQFIKSLDSDVRDLIRRYGIRNSHLTSIAPTGTISFTADNVSSGIEPVFGYEQDRNVIMPEGKIRVKVPDYGFSVLGVRGRRMADVTAEEHIKVLCTSQIHIDSAVSKTCNVPTDYPYEKFKNLYISAYEGGAKGCTTYRPNGNYEDVISSADVAEVKDMKEGESCRFDSTTGQRTGPCAE